MHESSMTKSGRFKYKIVQYEPTRYILCPMLLLRFDAAQLSNESCTASDRRSNTGPRRIWCTCVFHAGTFASMKVPNLSFRSGTSPVSCKNYWRSLNQSPISNTVDIIDQWINCLPQDIIGLKYMYFLIEKCFSGSIVYLLGTWFLWIYRHTANHKLKYNVSRYRTVYIYICILPNVTVD